ncbi:hypothetical protein AX17_002246 [Amanita inopinata Kibby_2008]|nr:hypothetical protein AX17_002246 [Amanita inopinata Kibby_2008]
MAISAAVPSGKSRLAIVADRRAATGGACADVGEDRDAFGSIPVVGASRVNGGKTGDKRARMFRKKNARVAPHTFKIPELYVNGKSYAEVEAEEAMYEIIDFYRGF